MRALRLPGKLGLLASLIIIIVSLAFSYAGVSTIDQLAASQSKRMMTSEIHSIQEKIKEAHDQLVDSGVGDVKSFLKNSQNEFLAGLKNYQLGKHGRLYIISEVGTPVFLAEDRNASDFRPEDLKRFITQTSGVIEAEVGGRPSLVALGGFKQWGWRLVLVLPDLEINAPRDKFLEKVALIVAASLVIGVPIFIWIATGFVRPIRTLAQQVSSITVDKLDERIEIGNAGPEVTELQQALTLMAKRLHAAIGERK